VLNKPFKRKSKYNAKPVTIDGIRFPSKKEGAYFEYLKSLQAAGDVKFFLRQVPFDIPAAKYKLDFLVFCADGTIRYIDVKGMMTPVSKLKIAQTEAIYGIKIELP